MNILYLSHLIDGPHAGPTYSVPTQIRAQAQYDNVFWYNAMHQEIAAWRQYPYYHDLQEYPQESIHALPAPFNKPDLIVVECFYNMAKSPLMRELMQGNIPYVIIPRGELTQQAQKRKWLKKWMANLWKCKRYAKKAVAIQYLTEQERKDAGPSWNKNYLIVPNGTTVPDRTKDEFSKDKINCVSIGRIEPYQKGLDLLIDVCTGLQASLREMRCTIKLCGPDRVGKLESLKKTVKDRGLDDVISFHDGVYGKEKESLLLESDVFLIPSRFEGHPMALIEALAYGLPAVATVGSNMKPEIDAYDAGWTAENTAESLGIALKNMLEDKDLFQEKSRHARELAQLYQWGAIAQRSHAAYEELVKR